MSTFRFAFLTLACLICFQTPAVENSPADQALPLEDSTSISEVKYYAQHACGLVGTVLGNYMRVPQIYEIWKNKSSKNVSAQASLVGLIALTAWELYGILGNDYMVIASSAVGITLQASLAGMIYYYRRHGSEAIPLLPV